MKKLLHVDPSFSCFFVVAVISICQSLPLKASTDFDKIDTFVTEKSFTIHANTFFVSTQQLQQYNNKSLQSDSLRFEVKLIKPRKFLLSFYKKQASDIFIKIYDVLGNLIHQEKVSKKGKFNKEYDLSKYKNELYVIEVGDDTSTETRRLFVG